VRHSGVGAALLQEATIVATAMGSRSVFLEVSVGNPFARRLYSRTGFVEVGRRPNYYPDNSDALVLRLDVRAAD
jgi:ribosomal-protein-alanine N-acetyltransferase